MARKKYKQPEPEQETPGKFMITLGGFVGFTVTFAACYFTGKTYLFSFVSSAVGCFIIGLIMKWMASYIEMEADRIRVQKAKEQRKRRLEEEIASEREFQETDLGSEMDIPIPDSSPQRELESPNEPQDIEAEGRKLPAPESTEEPEIPNQTSQA